MTLPVVLNVGSRKPAERNVRRSSDSISHATARLTRQEFLFPADAAMRFIMMVLLPMRRPRIADSRRDEMVRTKTRGLHQTRAYQEANGDTLYGALKSSIAKSEFKYIL